MTSLLCDSSRCNCDLFSFLPFISLAFLLFAFLYLVRLRRRFLFFRNLSFSLLILFFLVGKCRFREFSCGLPLFAVSVDFAFYLDLVEGDHLLEAGESDDEEEATASQVQGSKKKRKRVADEAIQTQVDMSKCPLGTVLFVLFNYILR